MARQNKLGWKSESSDRGLNLSHVMVVEDDPVLAMATEAMLRDFGARQVDVCPTTEAAMVVLKEKMPQALVLDVHLADRNDGWAIAELVEHLGENRPKIVFATGSPEEIPQAIAGLGTVLTKPYTPEELRTALAGSERKGFLARLRGES